MNTPAPSSKIKHTKSGILGSPQKLAVLALLSLILLWGYNWVIMKKVLVFIGPFDFSALRSLFAGITLLCALVLMRQPLRVRAWPRIILLGLLQTSLFSLLTQLALVQGAAGKTSTLVFTMPFWLIPMASYFLKEKVSRGQIIAIVLAAAGLILIFRPWSHQGSLTSELLAIVAGLCWAFSTLLAKWIQQKDGTSALTLTAWQLLCGSLVLCIFAWIIPEKPIVSSGYFYFALAYNALFATGLAWFLWTFVLRYLSAAITGMASLAIPVVGVLTGWLELGERPTTLDLSGMLLILFGLALLCLIPLIKHKT